MSYIKLEHRVLNDPRVLDLSAAALVAHVYALDWCNEQASDGEIPKKVAHRMMCQLDVVDIVDAFKELTVSGLWQATEEGYVCPDFLAYGLEADEQRATRAKWSQDKRRRRLHNIGNHALCLPASCPAKKAEGQNSTQGVELNPPKSGRLDQTRPDQTHKGSGSGIGTLPDGAEAPPVEPERWLDFIAEQLDDGHGQITVMLHEAATVLHPAFGVAAEWVARSIREQLEVLAKNHKCAGREEGGCQVAVDIHHEAPSESWLWIHVPAALTDSWAEHLNNQFIHAAATLQARQNGRNR